MTTIVATPEAIYADSYCADQPGFNITKVKKLSTPEGELLAGGAGDANEIFFIYRLLETHGLKRLWLMNMEENWPPRILKNACSTLLIVDRAGDIYAMDAQWCIPIKVENEFHAIGSGAELALSVLDGRLLNAPGAIAYAATRDIYTQTPIHRVSFEEMSDG